MYSILLLEQPTGDLNQIADDIADLLSVKAKTAKQIITHTPLIVFNELEEKQSVILIDVLKKQFPNLNWKINENDDQTPAVNWNKIPTINGKSLEDLFTEAESANNQHSITCPHCQGQIDLSIDIQAKKKPTTPKPSPVSQQKPETPQAQKQQESIQEPQAETLPNPIDESPESTIIKAADSVIMKLSADLEKSFAECEFDPSATSDSLPELAANSEQTRANLAPGLYQLFLPPLRSKTQKSLALNLCQKILGWTEEETIEALKKKMICVARNIDHLDGSKMMDTFEDKGLKLNSKKTASI